MTLRPNRFRPAAGVRSRLRNRLHEVLEEESEDSEDLGNQARTQSTRYLKRIAPMMHSDSNQCLISSNLVLLIFRIQNAARPSIASIRQRNSALNLEATTERYLALKNPTTLNHRQPWTLKDNPCPETFSCLNMIYFEILI